MTKEEALKKYFGYDSFRGGQEELIQAILQGRDVLGIMPTGAGKSVCFQVPTLLMEGITLVVSPLVSLMQDQVGALVQLGIPAAYINSTLSARQLALALGNAGNGKYKLIYVAPERLLNADFLEFAQNASIAMVTVDEAHCVSQWGQDFRPSYLHISTFVESLPRRPVISAFTATATPRVKEDIVQALALRAPKVLMTGFNRENLYFSVDKPKNKMAALLQFLQKNTGKAGIVYCLARKTVEEVCQQLCATGIPASRYHAGLSDAERRTNQDDFLFDRVRVMVATNAFGMGIDKSNVSFVAHYNMPGDMESYYQEAGRAGRDGTPAECLLLYSPQDVRTNQWMIENSKETAVPDAEKSAGLKARDYERLKQMTFYATTNSCLRAFILNYFGESTTAYCGYCSNCDTKFETVDVTVEAQKLLSCIHRMGERYGITLVIHVLRGAKNERIQQLGLDSLTTYGISDQSIDALRAIVGYLLENGYLVQTDEQYSVLKLTPAAREVLTGGKQLFMKLAKEKAPAAPKSSGKQTVPEGRGALYQLLRNLRGELARQQGVPAYVIFTDKALADMCARLPQTPEDFVQVSGVGEAKLQRYGRAFLTVISEYCSAQAEGLEP